MSTIRRPARPTPTHDGIRGVTEAPLLGECEDEDCGRRARTRCEACHGEYCLAHQRHPEH